MAIMVQRIVGVVLLSILSSDYVNSANVNVNGLEKRIDQDSYIDALHKTHAEDSLNCECKIMPISVELFAFIFIFFQISKIISDEFID